MVSDRLAIINKGNVVASGRLDEIKALTREKYRVVIEGKFEGLSNFEEVAKLGDRNIVYVKLRAEVSPVTLEDVFVKLVGGINNNGNQ